MSKQLTKTFAGGLMINSHIRPKISLVARAELKESSPYFGRTFGRFLTEDISIIQLKVYKLF